MDVWKKIHCQLSIAELEQMSRYLDCMNSAIKDNQRQTLADIEEIAKNVSEEDRSDFNDFYENDLIEAGSDFPILLFSTFLISWYSFIEHKLISLCTILGRVKSKKNNYIDKAKKFLDEEANYTIKKSDWDELMHIREIRNNLVHEGGILIPTPKQTRPDKTQPNVLLNVPINLGEDGVIYLPIDAELYKYLTDYKLYQVGHHRLTPDYNYCKHLVKFGTQLLERIYKDLNLIT